ncbi:hypothetical protein VTL71DRAFT_15734 [Oculimacula yallundae]|uniref:Centromere protein S n=1 Tax=Oculimacula yallundae TaxID=86028 RepID=A0ABR4CCI7_9HELO
MQRFHHMRYKTPEKGKTEGGQIFGTENIRLAREIASPQILFEKGNITPLLLQTIEIRSIHREFPFHTQKQQRFSEKMSQQSQEEDTTQEKLKASLWFSVGKLVDEEASSLNTTATPQFIGSMSEMVWAQLENVAIDLESFARHANRSTITTDDVLLMTRRNDALQGMMREFVEAEKGKNAAKDKGKGKAKARAKK